MESLRCSVAGAGRRCLLYVYMCICVCVCMYGKGFVPGSRFPLHWRNSLGWIFHRGTRYPLHYRNSFVGPSGRMCLRGSRFPVPFVIRCWFEGCHRGTLYPLHSVYRFGLLGWKCPRGTYPVPGTLCITVIR